MKHTTFATRLAAAAFAALVAAPATGQAADPPAPRTPDTAPVTTEYRLGAGDKLRVEVYKDSQVSQSVQIRPDGKITLPLVGDIEAVGRTPLELRDEIAKALKEYMTNPVVTVIVVEALASQVFVMGEVAKSGPVQIYGPTNILQALAMAGGLNEFANKKDVRVLRQGPSGPQTIKFNYQDAINGNVRPIFLRPGDTIIVR
jgi:polysaccharide export outer membrane protein